MKKFFMRIYDWLDFVQSKLFSFLNAMLLFMEKSWFNCLIAFIPMVIFVTFITFFFMVLGSVSLYFSLIVSFLSDCLRWDDESKKNN